MTGEPKPIISAQAINEAASRVFTREELTAMPRPQLLTLGSLVAKRLDQAGPPPTQDELEGIRELVTEHLWHGALSKHASR